MWVCVETHKAWRLKKKAWRLKKRSNIVRLKIVHSNMNFLVSRSIVIVFGVLILLNSCRSIRQANFIERTFLLAKLNDTFPKVHRVPYVTKLSQIQSTEYNHSTGNFKNSAFTTVDIFIIDTVNGEIFAIDDRKSVFRFLANEPNAAPYIKDFQRRKVNQRIHRYSSLGLMASGIFVMAKWGGGESGPTSNQQRILGNTGAYMFLGGFLNWIGGGFSRTVIRRKIPMKAIYEYYFGPFPKKTPHIKRSERRAILKQF